MSQKPEKPLSKLELILEARRLGCQSCVYFSIADLADQKGQCRRSAPTREAVKEVAKDYWCGEFFSVRQT